MPLPDVQTLRTVAKKHLTEHEQEDFEECLEYYYYGQQADLGVAQWYIMQVIESHCHRGHLSKETAHHIYDTIGLCPVKKTHPHQCESLPLQHNHG